VTTIDDESRKHGIAQATKLPARYRVSGKSPLISLEVANVLLATLARCAVV
jgi:hypothetical protein